MLGFHLRGSEDKIKLIYLIIQVLKRKIAIIYTCEFFKKSLRQEYDLNCFKVGNNKKFFFFTFKFTNIKFFEDQVFQHCSIS